MKLTSAFCLILLLAACRLPEKQEPTVQPPLKWEPRKASKVETSPTTPSIPLSPTPPAPAPQEASPLVQDLQELASLYADGHITEEEYLALKAQKLGLPVSPVPEPPSLPDTTPALESENPSVVEAPKKVLPVRAGPTASSEQEAGPSALSFTQVGLLRHDLYSGYELDFSRELSESTFAAFSASQLTPDNDSSYDIYLFTVEAGAHKQTSDALKVHGSLLVAHEILDTWSGAYEDTYSFLRGGGIYSITDRLALDFELNYSLDKGSVENFGFLRARYFANDRVSIGVEMNVLGDYRDDTLLFGLRFNQ